MSHLLPNLENFFQKYTRTVQDANEQNDPNRVESLVVHLCEYKRTLDVVKMLIKIFI